MTDEIYQINIYESGYNFICKIYFLKVTSILESINFNYTNLFPF